MSGEVQIPAEAVERADIWGGQIPLGDLRESLERAAPLILAANAQAWLADAFPDEGSDFHYSCERLFDLVGKAAGSAVLRGETGE